MAGMGTLNPVRAKSYLGTPNLGNISALLALQNKQLKSGAEGVGDVGRISRAKDLDTAIQGMDLSKATPEDIAKLRGGQSMTPQAMERLKGLEKTAGTLQEQGYRTGAATTLFDRQKEMQGMRDASAMARVNKQIGAKPKAMTPEEFAGTKASIQTSMEILRTPLSKDPKEAEKQKILKKEATQNLNRDEYALATGMGKLTSGTKETLGDFGGASGVAGLKGKGGIDLEKAFTTTSKVFTGALGDSFKNQDSTTQQNMAVLHNAGVVFGPGQIIKDEDGKSIKDKKGRPVRDRTLTYNGKPISPEEIQRMVEYLGTQQGY